MTGILLGMSALLSATQVQSPVLGGRVTLGSSTPEKVLILGERHVAVFDCSGVTTIEFNTAKDYNDRFINLAKGQKPTPPTKTDCTWKSSSRSTEYNTIDGFIHPNQYALTVENATDKVFFMLPNGQFQNWEKTNVQFLKAIPDVDLQ